MHKSALCLVLSDVPVTQQGRRKKPCHKKVDDGGCFDQVLLLLLHTASFVPQQELMLLVSPLATCSVRGSGIQVNARRRLLIHRSFSEEPCPRLEQRGSQAQGAGHWHRAPAEQVCAALW